MLLFKINTQVINVELTTQRKDIIERHLQEIADFIAVDHITSCDLVIRKMHRAWGKDVFAVMVRVVTNEKTYYAVAHRPDLSRSLAHAVVTLRRSVSQVYNPAAAEVRQVRNRAIETYAAETLAK